MGWTENPPFLEQLSLLRALYFHSRMHVCCRGHPQRYHFKTNSWWHINLIFAIFLFHNLLNGSCIFWKAISCICFLKFVFSVVEYVSVLRWSCAQYTWRSSWRTFAKFLDTVEPQTLIIIIIHFKNHSKLCLSKNWRQNCQLSIFPYKNNLKFYIFVFLFIVLGFL